MMKFVFLNIILILFPILMYLVFSCYNLLVNKKIEKLIFIITMCTSLYLCLNFNDNSYDKMLLFCNIPIIICYLKKECFFGVILSLIVIIFSYFRCDVNIFVVIFKYLSYLITYIILYKSKNFNYLFFKIIAVIQGFFISFEYFMNSYNGFDKIFGLIIYTSLIYSITFFCLYLFKLADNITSLYLTVNKVTEENRLKNSLFKLTHEIKNPIAVCKGYLDMINLDDINKSKRYIDIVKSEIDRSLNVMNDFMEYSKIKINKEIFDLVMLMDEVYDSFNILLNDKDIKFDYDNNYEEVYLWGDYERLKQVFVNVIKNSIESISNDGIIGIKLEVIDKWVKIIISDNGIGMDREELSNIKEMFYTTKKCGTGLGVALSNEIILAHNGELNYDSVKNEGTKCIISLPM